MGSVTSLTDATGAAIAAYTYDGFGNCTAAAGIANPFRYNGREWDEETGLYYYRARYYDAAVGRFLTEDPLGGVDGPNFYSYVNNNPANDRDPLGLWSAADVGDVVAGMGDSLTFGITADARDAIADYMGIPRVNKCSGFYIAGEWLETAGEVALTMGSAALKKAAARAVKKTARNRAHAYARKLYPNIKKGYARHHGNPLFGHPNGLGPALFPTGGLRPSINSMKLSISVVPKEVHVLRHYQLKMAEDLVRVTVVNRHVNSARALRNFVGNCDCLE